MGRILFRVLAAVIIVVVLVFGMFGVVFICDNVAKQRPNGVTFSTDSTDSVEPSIGNVSRVSVKTAKGWGVVTLPNGAYVTKVETAFPVDNEESDVWIWFAIGGRKYLMHVSNMDGVRRSESMVELR